MRHNARIPSGPIQEMWDRSRFEMKLVNPANKRKYSVIVVGSGLAGGAGAATMAELGYNVKCFCYQDSPRRAHPSPRKAESTPPRITRTTATASGGCSTTPSRAAISAPARPTFTGWLRSA